MAHAVAYHSFAAEFDVEKPVTLEGSVVKWEMINPHGWITVDVAGPAGEKVQWMVETSHDRKNLLKSDYSRWKKPAQK